MLEGGPVWVWVSLDWECINHSPGHEAINSDVFKLKVV